MRTLLLSIILAPAMMMGLASCDDDDDNNAISVPEEYVSALQSKYPDAKLPQWSIEGQYYVAEFHNPQEEYDVWFGTGAKWAMTEIDYGKNLFFIPSAVSGAFAESEYGTGYTVDEVKAYVYPAKCIYHIEAEPNDGGRDVYLYYTEDGSLVKNSTIEIKVTPDTQF